MRLYSDAMETEDLGTLAIIQSGYSRPGKRTSRSRLVALGAITQKPDGGYTLTRKGKAVLAALMAVGVSS